MNMVEWKQALFQQELAKVETIAGLRHALDLRYRRLREAARADWERLFGPKDPADACVSVRATAAPSGAIRGSGFLKSRRSSGQKSATKGLPGFAH